MNSTVRPQTVMQLFNASTEEWLEETRQTARELLKTRNEITIEQVLAVTPRPDYIHRNATGKVFKHPDFKVTGFTKATKPLAKGRIICKWGLTYKGER